MKSTICTTETGLVLGAKSLEGEDGTFARAGALPAAGGDGRRHYARKP
jgi:hypothetical protein